MRAGIKEHCEERPHVWPASSRYPRYATDTAGRDRIGTYSGVVQTTILYGANAPREGPRRGVVNLETGEITDSPP